MLAAQGTAIHPREQMTNLSTRAVCGYFTLADLKAAATGDPGLLFHWLEFLLLFVVLSGVAYVKSSVHKGTTAGNEVGQREDFRFICRATELRSIPGSRCV